MNDDTTLLRQYATEKSNLAFEELVRRHIDLVYSLALRKVGGDAHAAHDVSQAAFLALAANAARLAKHQALTGWLYLTTHHLAAQWVRSDRRRKNRENIAHAMNELEREPDVDWQEVRPALDEALRTLHEEDREAVLLRYFERQAFADIGRTLHLSEDAARMRVDRALDRLRSFLSRRGVSSSAAALAAVLGNQVSAAPAGLALMISGRVAANAGKTGMLARLFGLGSRKVAIGAVAAVIGTVGAAVYLMSSASRFDSSMAAPRRINVTEQQPANNSHAPATHSVDQLALSRPVPGEATQRPSIAEERSAPLPAAAHQAEIDRTLAGYSPFFRKLSLNENQLIEFKALLTSNLHRKGDLADFARSDGTRPVDPDISDLTAQADAELANEIRLDFGDTTLESFQYFNATGPLRELTGQLTTTLATTVTPLTAEQEDKLIDILARNCPTADDGKLNINSHTLRFDEAMAQASSILSPPQIAALQSAYKSWRE